MVYLLYWSGSMKKGKKKKQIKKSAKRIVVFGLTALITIILVLFSVAKVIVQIFDKYQEADELEQKLADLKVEEENLNDEILKLQDPEYLARYAREKYFYSKDGELIIRIPTLK